jgi:hypothetical protein
VKDQAASVLGFGLRRRAARGLGGSGCGCVLKESFFIISL